MNFFFNLTDHRDNKRWYFDIHLTKAETEKRSGYNKIIIYKTSCFGLLYCK